MSEEQDRLRIVSDFVIHGPSEDHFIIGKSPRIKGSPEVTFYEIGLEYDVGVSQRSFCWIGDRLAIEKDDYIIPPIPAEEIPGKKPRKKLLRRKLNRT